MTGLNEIPLQTISKKEKLAIKEGEKVPSWIVDNCNYFSTESQYFISNKAEMLRLLDLVYGEINKEDFEYVTNPFKQDKQNNARIDQKTTGPKQYPAKLRNYNIIKPIVDRVLGEFRSSFKPPTVFAVGPEDVNAYQEARKSYLEKVTYQKVYNELVKQGVIQDERQAQDNKSLQEIQEEFLQSFSKERAKDGQQALKWMMRALDIESKVLEMLFFYTVFGETYSFKDINHDDVYYEAVSPLSINVIGWNGRGYAEDAVAVVREDSVPITEIFDRWREKLVKTYGEEIIDNLYQSTNLSSNAINAYVYDDHFVRQATVDYHYEASGMSIVEHITWKSQERRGILTYIDDFGQIRETTVDEDYKLNKAAGDIDIEWIPEGEWWQARRIKAKADNAGKLPDLYLDWGPGEVQRNEINNTSVCKLPYNGVTSSYIPGVIDSKVKIGEPYQALYNIFHFHFELALARNKGKVLLFPLGLVPDGKGWDPGRFFDTMHAFAVAFFNEQADKAIQALQAIKEIDLSLSQYMADMWQFMNEIKNEYWDAVNMNRQRYGDVTGNDGKAVTNQAVYRSALGDLDWIRRFEQFLDKDYDGLLDYAKVAWIDGKQAFYSTSDGYTEMMKIEGLNFMEREFGVFTSSASRDKEKVDFLKNTLLQPMAQNGATPATLIKVLKEDNLHRIEDLIEKGERIQRRMMEQMQQAEAENEQQKMQAEMADKEADRQLERDLADLKAAVDIEKALIMSDSFNAAEGDTDGDGMTASEEIAKRSRERQSDLYGRLLDRRNYQLQRDKMQLDREKMRTQERIAKENKNRYDK